MIDRLHIVVGQTQGDMTGSTNAVLQSAVDRAAALGGGAVHILRGVYDMHDSLYLRSGVTVQGSGADTVLRKVPSVQSAIPAFLGYGHYDISVAEPEKLHVGMGVLIQDDESKGFYDTVATLIWRDGDRFGINRMLNHDYHVNNHATVTSVYPVISGCELTHAAVTDLVIDGNKDENAYLNGCRGGGVYLIQAHDVTLRNVTVKAFNGDGISFQQCARTTIEACTLADNAGHGLHPGSGSVAPIIRRCKCLNNGSDGIFYCLRVTYSLCEGCEISGNGCDGISIGERDSHHLIRHNTISKSGRYGIYFRQTVPGYGGNDNVIEHNRIWDNGQKDGADKPAEIFMEPGIQHIHIISNRFGPPHLAGAAIHVEQGCEDITIVDNQVDLGYKPTIEARDGAVSMRPPTQPLVIGPECVPAGGLLHLNLT
jgi:hypothetical protein